MGGKQFCNQKVLKSIPSLLFVFPLLLFASLSFVSANIIDLGNGLTCEDSDSGINPGVKGWIQTTNRDTGLKTPKEYDYCYNSDTLIEKGCKNTQVIDCPFGCSDGKCSSNPTDIGLCPAGTTDYYCSSVDLHSRFKCIAGVTLKYSCGVDKYCDNGDCISIIDGYIPSDDYNYCPNGLKYCSSPSQYVECNPSSGKITTYTCPSGNICKNNKCEPNCPYGVGVPYCSSLVGDEAFYYQCDRTAFTDEYSVNKYSCEEGFLCSQGDKCFHTGIFPSGDSITDIFSDLFGGVWDIFVWIFWIFVIAVVLIIILYIVRFLR